MEEGERNELVGLLGHRFIRPEHLEHALTHRSQRQGTVEFDNERLEFLGDRILGLVASEHLFRCFQEWDAGKLSKALARLVSAETLLSSAQQLDLGRYLRLGRGEEKTGGREKKRLLVDAYEAIIGAIYLDAGLAPAAAFIHRTLIEPALASEVQSIERSDHKSALQEWLQERGLTIVEYRLHSATGPDHRKLFEVAVWHEGRHLASSLGPTKKEAEQRAASLALEKLRAGVPASTA
jgi:ribonuclease III